MRTLCPEVRFVYFAVTYKWPNISLTLREYNLLPSYPSRQSVARCCSQLRSGLSTVVHRRIRVLAVFAAQTDDIRTSPETSWQFPA
jgi:hypothetical protein